MSMSWTHPTSTFRWYARGADVVRGRFADNSKASMSAGRKRNSTGTGLVVGNVQGRMDVPTNK